MAGNKVTLEITAEDKTDRAFASVAAQEAALSRLSDQTTRKEIAGHQAVVGAIDAHARATKLLDDAERVLDDTTRDTSSRFDGFVNTIQGLLNGALPALGSSFSSLAGSMGDTQIMGVSLNVWLFAFIPLIAAAVTALTPFIAGLVTVTAGVAGFAALAVPEITKVWDAVSKGGAALKRLSPDERQMVGPIRSLKSEFSGLQKAIQPEVMKAFGEGLKIIRDLLPAIRPLLVAAGQALDGFLKNIDKWLNSPGGKKFIQWLQVEGPMAMKMFGHDLWVTANDVGDVFHFMYDLGEWIDARWRTFWHAMAQIVDGFRTGFTQMGHLIESIWNQTIGFVVDTKGAVLLSWFQALPGRILGFLAALPGMLFNAGVHAMEGLISGLTSQMGSLGSIMSGIAAKVAGFFGLSPAKEGPLSGGGAPEIRGRHFAEAFASGMGSGRGLLGAAANGLAGAAALRGPAGAAGAGGQLVIEFHAGSNPLSQQFFTELANGIRVRGGSPQLITRKVVFQ